MGSDCAFDHRASRPEGLDGPGQPDVRRGGAVDRAHRFALAGTAGGLRRIALVAGALTEGLAAEVVMADAAL